MIKQSVLLLLIVSPLLLTSWSFADDIEYRKDVKAILEKRYPINSYVNVIMPGLFVGEYETHKKFAVGERIYSMSVYFHHFPEVSTDQLKSLQKNKAVPLADGKTFYTLRGDFRVSPITPFSETLQILDFWVASTHKGAGAMATFYLRGDQASMAEQEPQPRVILTGVWRFGSTSNLLG